MLAQSPPQSIFPSSSVTKSKYSLSMDLSPSRFVTHPSRPPPLSIEVANQATHASPFDFRALLQAAAQADSGGPVLESALLAHGSQVPATVNSSSEQLINPRALLSQLAMGENMTGTGQHSLGESSTPSSSSLSSASQPQDLVHSRRSSGSSEASPQSAPTEPSMFYRTANPSARQRTSQACDKCRERKTKCTGNRPICKRCTDRGLKCVWSPDTRIRGSAKPRIDTEDNMGEPVAALPFPLSEPVSLNSSPLFKAQDFTHSAPATQTSFSPNYLQANYLTKNRHNRNVSHPTGIVKGVNAHCVMGEPIKTLCSVDDCWFPVWNAEVERPSRDRSGTIMPRERGRSVSVARLARAQELHLKAQPVIEIRTAGFPDQQDAFYNIDESSNESSPSPKGDSQPTPFEEMSGIEPTLTLPEFRHSSEEYKLQQPFASYESSSQLDEEMMKLLHFPRGADNAQGSSSGSFVGMHPLADLRTQFDFDSPAEEVVPLVAGQQKSKESADDLIAQYFDADAFDKMQE